MDCQLKQTAFFGTDERSRRRPLERHYEAPGAQTPLPDIARRVVVGWRSEAAADAPEVVPGSAAPLVDYSAARALSARVAGVNENDGDTLERRLVGYQRPQLVEPPICHPCPLAPLNLDPVSDTFEVFEGDQTPAAFGVGNDGFAQDVVGMALESRLPAGIALERASRGTRVDLLQGAATRMPPAANDFHLFASVGFPGVVDGEIHDAKVDSERIVDFEKGCFIRIAGCCENPLPANEHQVDLAFGAREHLALPTTAGKRDTEASRNRPDRNGILAGDESKDPLVVRLGGKATERAWLVLSADLKRIRDLGDATHRRLSGEPEAFAHANVCQMVQVELSRLSGFDGALGNPRARGVASLQGIPKGDSLSVVRQKANGGNELQSGTLLGFDVAAHNALGHRADRTGVVTAIPKRRQARTQARKFLAQNATRPTLDSVDDFSHAQRWVRLHKQVNVVGHHLKRMHRHLVLGRDLGNQLFQARVNRRNQHLAPILRAPYEVVFQAENRPCAALVPCHGRYYTTAACLMRAERHDAFPPSPEGDGFQADLL